MPLSTAALGAAPFAEDQLAQIKRLVAGSTAEQRQWLSGYIAGFQAATEGRQAARTVPRKRSTSALRCAACRDRLEEESRT